MNRRLGTDSQLMARMGLTMFLLAALYGVFVWVLLQAGVGMLGMVVIVGGLALAQWYFSDRMVLMSMGAKIVSREQAPQLYAIVERLVNLAGIPMPRLALVRTSMPNAFATGRSPQNAVVAVTTGLLERLETHEVEAVLAHELSHIRNRDVTVMTVASFFATLASYLTQMFFWFGPVGGVGSRDDDRGAGWGFIVYLVSLLVYVISFFLIQALSRYREHAADTGSALLTGAPSHLASALIKISGTMQRIPTRDLRAPEGMNAFFIFPALRGESLAQLFSTHPSLESRLQHLQQLEEELSRRR